MGEKPFHNPFGSLSHLRGDLPVAPAPAVPASVEVPPSGVRVIARAVVRMERSGRSGKEVTVVEHLGLNSTEREAWLKALKAGLGCGGTVEDDSLVLQGDHRKRLPVLLTRRGVKKVTVG